MRRKLKTREGRRVLEKVKQKKEMMKSMGRFMKGERRRPHRTPRISKRPWLKSKTTI